MAIGTPRRLPQRQTRLRAVDVLRKRDRRARDGHNGQGQNGGTRATYGFYNPDSCAIHFRCHLGIRSVLQTANLMGLSYRATSYSHRTNRVSRYNKADIPAW